MMPTFDHPEVPGPIEWVLCGGHGQYVSWGPGGYEVGRPDIIQAWREGDVRKRAALLNAAGIWWD